MNLSPKLPLPLQLNRAGSRVPRVPRANQRGPPLGEAEFGGNPAVPRRRWKSWWLGIDLIGMTGKLWKQIGKHVEQLAELTLSWKTMEQKQTNIENWGIEFESVHGKLMENS